MLIYCLLLVIILLLLILLVQVRRMYHALNHYNKLVADRTMSRQAQVRISTSSKPRPKVDSKARTTRRDTNDLPATGQMSNIHVTPRKESP